MSNLSNQLFPFEIPLGSKARSFANKFAVQYTDKKREQVYHSALAIYVVNCFLEFLDIQIDTNQGDVWNYFTQAVEGVAEVILPDIGRLRCCPILSNENIVKLNPGLELDDLLGCIVVKFDKDLKQAEISGFIPCKGILPKSIAIEKLKPIDEFIDFITRKEAELINKNRSAVQKSNSEEKLFSVNLSQWFKGILENNWQDDVDIFSNAILCRLNCRKETEIHKGKRIYLGEEEGQCSLIVLLEKIDENEEYIEITVIVQALSEEEFLPKELKLDFVYTNGETTSNQLRKPVTSFIFDSVTGEVGDSFSVILSLGEKKVIENFIV